MDDKIILMSERDPTKVDRWTLESMLAETLLEVRHGKIKATGAIVILLDDSEELEEGGGVNYQVSVRHVNLPPSKGVALLEATKTLLLQDLLGFGDGA